MKSILIPVVDKLIIKIGRKITSSNLNSNVINDFNLLLHTLKSEAKYVDCKEISNDLTSISQTINQNHIVQKLSIKVWKL